MSESQNAWDRYHWAKRHARRDEWFWTVISVCGRCGFKPSSASVSICRVSNRLIDLQNVSSATKPILDALVEYGWLRGDGPKVVLEFSTTQKKCGRGETPHMTAQLRYAE